MAKEEKMSAEDIAPILSNEIIPIVYAGQADSLVETLKRFNVPNRYYSLFSAKDDSMCLMYRDGKWVTFIYERGNEANLLTFDDFDSAADEVLEIGADDAEELEQMKMYYRNLVERNQRSEVSSSGLNAAIKKVAKKLTETAAVI